MPRSGDDARRRLRRAAIELFAESGFDEITAAQIAARAGVTERTFFRHFPDKREVLFDGQEILGAALAKAIAAAPAALSPMRTLQHAFATVAALLEGNRQFSEPRQRIIAATPALKEREAAKHAALAGLVADALQERGVARLRSELAAQAGMAVLSHALAGWFADPGARLTDYLNRAFEELQDLSARTEGR